MSRHQGNDKSRPGSGRQGGFKKSSNSRGNAPIRKTPSKFSVKPTGKTEAREQQHQDQQQQQQQPNE